MNQKSKVVAIIQARMGSTRLPGKVLADINGRPMLWHVVNRVGFTTSIDQTIVATSIESDDDPISNFCLNNGIECFRGDNQDVLDRFYQAASQFKADTVVRVTADCPFIDPDIISQVVTTFQRGDYDYVSNILRYTYPDGLDVEVFSFPTLKSTWQEALMPSEREHVTPYMRWTSDRFRVRNVENKVDLSRRNLRWTVDEQSDLDFVRTIYSSLWRNEHQPFVMDDVLQFLDRGGHQTEPEKKIIRNEGYYKSLISETPIPPSDRVLERSYKLQARAKHTIPSSTQTFSKGPTQFVQGVSPIFLSRGYGSHVWDVDGNEYIDYAMALGPIILGHNYPAVTNTVTRQIQDGIIFSLPHPSEVEVAETLIETIPCADMARFGKNGSDATSGAVRVARAFTGKEIVACSGYHGWQDWYIGTTTRNKGVPKSVRDLTMTFEYNNIESLERIFDAHPNQVAAVIMEPVGLTEPNNGFLMRIRELTKREGALLIFDEVITGFRIALGGAQDYFNVVPDLACFGKAMANGYPISAVVGKREVMEIFDEVFFSFTFGGDALSLTATAATIAEMSERNVIGHLWDQGRRLKDGYNALAKEYEVEKNTECIGLPPRTVITFKDENGSESLILKSLFQQECLKRSVLFTGGQNICYSHSNADIEHTLRVYRTSLDILSQAVREGDALDRLEGEPIQPVFRQA